MAFDKNKPTPQKNESTITTPLEPDQGLSQSDRLQPQSGLVLGDTYRLEKILGQGGMGQVWLATHLLLNAPRAIKLVLGHIGQAARVRFIQGEAKNALKLLHPNIVRVYDVAQHQGLPYIVMEYIQSGSEGADLKQWLKAKGKFDPEEASKLLEQIAQGLAVAHEQGLIHRDLKPANILITSTGQAKISDFGLVKDLQAEEALTLNDYILGTPLYMAPEQALGEAEVRSDLYSLGIMLYEMLVGQPPFRGTGAKLVHQHTTTPPTPPHQLNPALSAEISAVLIKALAKQSEERYSSVLEFAEAFRAAVRQEAALVLGPQSQTVTASAAPHGEDKAKFPNNLPQSVTEFIGREQEIAEVSALVWSSKTRLVTLTGVGGTGKTRLALAVATNILLQFKHGVYFVGLENITERATLVSELATVLGLRDQPGQPLLEVLKAYLAEKELLLVLDNYEQLVAKGATLLPELLKVAPGLKLLVTSRLVLQVSMEKEYSVAPLPLPLEEGIELTPASLAEYTAIALFVARAQAVKPDFALTAENAPIIVEICRKLDGLPLALELAAVRVRVFPPHKVLERLSLKLLTGGFRDSPARQQTLYKTIEWSYELLEEGEQSLFARLSIFAGGCTLEAAEAVCNPGEDLTIVPLEGIESLVLKNLLQQREGEAGERRYTMLQTIREYALEKLMERGELPQLRRDYAAYYTGLAQETGAKLKGWVPTSTLKMLDSEWANVREVFYQGLQSGDSETTLAIGGALWSYWEARGYLSEGCYYLEQALTLQPVGAIPDQKRAKTLYGAGMLNLRRGEYGRAQQYLEESLVYFEQLGDKNNIATCQLGLGLRAYYQGDYSSARQCYEESLALFRETNDPIGVVYVLGNLSNLTITLGDYSTARRYLEENLATYRQMGNIRNEAVALNGLGVVALYQEEYLAAQQYLEESLSLAYKMEDRQLAALVLGSLANAFLQQGEYSKAKKHFEKSLVLAREVGAKYAITHSLVGLAWLVSSHFLQVYADQTATLVNYLMQVTRLSGAITTLLDSTKIILEQLEQGYYTKLLEVLRTNLSEESYNTAFAQGQRLDLETAINYALSLEDGA